LHKSRRLKPWIAVAALLFTIAPGGAWAQQKIRVATLYIGSSMLPLWIAKEEGEFARRGLDVELIWLQSTLSTFALVASEVDLIFGTPQETLLAMNVANPPPLVTIGSWESKAADEGYARIILRRYGVDSTKVAFISAGGQRDRAGALRSGTVQGSVFNTYNSLALEEAGYKKLALLETPQFPFPPATYTTRKDFVIQKHEPLKAFMAAVTETTRRHNQDRDTGIQLLKKYMKIGNPKVLEAAYQDGIINQYPYMTREQLSASLDILEASTGVRPKITFEQFVDHSLLQEAKLKQDRRS
jgi:ABC-type nitrate/sulfonate/bicarbonate transport system substrate-binding protein